MRRWIKGTLRRCTFGGWRGFKNVFYFRFLDGREKRGRDGGKNWSFFVHFFSFPSITKNKCFSLCNIMNWNNKTLILNNAIIASRLPRSRLPEGCRPTHAAPRLPRPSQPRPTEKSR